MLAQDVVLETLTVEQEKHLFAMSIEQTKTEQRNPDVFGGLNALSTSLLYAKKMANNAHVMQKAELINFIQSPLYIDQKTMQYLEDYVTVKYR